jgi:hypothetical protein
MIDTKKYLALSLLILIVGLIIGALISNKLKSSSTCPICPTCSKCPSMTIAQALVGASPPKVNDGTQAIDATNGASYYTYIFSDCLNSGTCTNDISTLDPKSVSAVIINNKEAGAWVIPGYTWNGTNHTVTDPSVGTKFWVANS